MSKFINTLRRSPNDKLEYLAGELDNKLRVVLVSDPETQECAAALRVRVGSMEDPKSALGLAHFLEHMLFMGSHKYPDPSGYSSFITKNGGSSNAYTSLEDTMYHFNIVNKQFPEAVSRFASFFTDTLLSKDCVDKEINAVNSEHEKNLNNDDWKEFQLSRHLSSPQSTYNGFATGNLQTLKHDNIYGLLREFYDQKYSSNLMNLVLYGNQNVETLKQLVLDNFANVKNKDLPELKYDQKENWAYRSEDVNRLVLFGSESEIKRIKFKWFFPYDPSEYRSDPYSILSHTIGHEAEGSLLSGLKSERLAFNLMCGAHNNSNIQMELVIDIGLTEEGWKNVPRVLQFVGNYMKLLQAEGGIPETIFDEVRMMNEIKFRFQEKKNPVSKCMDLANRTPIVPIEDYLIAPYLMEEYKRERYAEIVQALKIENSLVMMVNNKFEEDLDQTEPIYKSKYKVSSIPQEFVSAWNSTLGDSVYKMHLPKVNKFIPKNFDLHPIQKLDRESVQKGFQNGKKHACCAEKTQMNNTNGEIKNSQNQKSNIDSTAQTPANTKQKQNSEGESKATEKDENASEKPKVYPIQIDSDEFGNTWFKQDDTFLVPKMNYYSYIYCDLTAVCRYSDARVYLRLWADILEEYLNEFKYLAEMASLKAIVSPMRKGFSVSISGYSDSIKNFLPEYGPKLKAYVALAQSPEGVALLHQQFDSMKEKLLRRETKRLNRDPFRSLFDSLDGIMILNIDNEFEWIEGIKSANFDTYLKFHQHIFDRNYYQELFVGNLVLDEARAESAKFHENMLGNSKTNVLPLEDIVDNKVAKLPEQTTIVLTKDVHNKKEPNSATMMIFQCERGRNNQFFAQLLTMLVEDKFFEDLRTKQQLGYVVISGWHDRKDIFGIHFMVQSALLSASELGERINKFLAENQQEFTNVDETLFNTMRDALIAEYKKKKKTLAQEASFYWDFILKWRSEFDFNERAIEFLEKAKLEDFNAFVSEVLYKKKRILEAHLSSKASKEKSLAHLGERTKRVKDRLLTGGLEENARMIVVENEKQLKKFVEFYPDFHTGLFDE